MKTVESGMTFFRVFDIAFFAPGTLLAGVCLWRWKDTVPGLASPLNSTEGVLLVFSAISLVYTLGLVVHSISWQIYQLLNKKEKTPLLSLIDSSALSQMVLYMWYLRATCWNLSLAIVISTCILYFDDATKSWIWMHWVGAACIALALLLQGISYDGGVKRNRKKLEERAEKRTTLPAD